MNANIKSGLITAVCLIASLVFFQLPTVSASKPLTVCEILQHLAKYRGHVLEVQGEFNGGELRGECVPLKTGSITWINAIDLEFPSEVNATEKENKANWKYDETKHNGLIMDQILAMHKAAPNKKVLAIVKGRLDVFKEIKTVTNQPPVLLGYGHLNVYPARLALMDIHGIAYEDHSAIPAVIPHAGSGDRKVFE